MRKNTACILLAAALLLTAALSGCGDTTGIQQGIIGAANNAGADTTPESGAAKEISDLLDSYAADKDNPDPLLNRTVRFSEADVQAIWTVVDNIKAPYPYADISNVKEALERHRALPELAPRKPTGLLASGWLDADELYSTVMANNARYMAEGKYNYIEMENEYVQGVCAVITDTVNRELANYGFTDTLGELDYNLTNLCILSGHGLSNAAVTDDGCMLIQPKLAENMKWLADNDQAVSIAYSHEVEHLFQKVSTEARQALGVERAYGFCRVFPDLDINPLYFNWFLEASAEKLAIALYDSEPTTYTTKIGYLDSLTYAGMFRDGVSPVDIPRLSQQHSLERVFELFDLDAYERQIEFLNMMWAINVIQESPEDFMRVYAGQLEHEPDYEFTDAELTELRIAMKESLCVTFSKYFYENLAGKMAGESVSLTDLFLLISIWEADLNYHITYTDETRYDSMKKFLAGYADIQNAFFERVAVDLDVGAEELAESYNAYNAAIKVQKNVFLVQEEAEEQFKNIAIPWLTTEENSFISKQFSAVANKKTVSIRQMIDIFARLSEL
jgi:hypothetical protein